MTTLSGRPYFFMMRLRKRRGLVPLRRDDRFQDLAFMVDSAPEIAELAVDLHERLIQMPPPLRMPAHVRYPPFSDLSGKHRAETVPPKPDRLMADVDPALGQEILDVAQRQRVLHVHQHRQTDYLGRAVEKAKRVAHGLTLTTAKDDPKNWSDNAAAATTGAHARPPGLEPVIHQIADVRQSDE